MFLFYCKQGFQTNLTALSENLANCSKSITVKLMNCLNEYIDYLMTGERLWEIMFNCICENDSIFCLVVYYIEEHIYKYQSNILIVAKDIGNLLR